MCAPAAICLTDNRYPSLEQQLGELLRHGDLRSTCAGRSLLSERDLQETQLKETRNCIGQGRVGCTRGSPPGAEKKTSGFPQTRLGGGAYDLVVADISHQHQLDDDLAWAARHGGPGALDSLCRRLYPRVLALATSSS